MRKALGQPSQPNTDIADIKKLTGELQNASKMHLAQSKRVKAHVDMMSKEFAKRPAELGAIQGLKQIVGELERHHKHI